MQKGTADLWQSQDNKLNMSVSKGAVVARIFSFKWCVS